MTTQMVTIKSKTDIKMRSFVVVGKHPEPNAYCIQPVNGNGPVWTVNQCQLQDLGRTHKDEGLTSP